jgi:hypothetical protein
MPPMLSQTDHDFCGVKTGPKMVNNLFLNCQKNFWPFFAVISIGPSTVVTVALISKAQSRVSIVLVVLLPKELMLVAN